MSQPSTPASSASPAALEPLAPRRGPTRAEMYGAKPAAAAPRAVTHTDAAVASGSSHSSSGSSSNGGGRWERAGGGGSDSRFGDRSAADRNSRGFDRDQAAGRSQRSNGGGAGAGGHGGGGYRDRESRGGAGSGAASNDRRGAQRSNDGGPSSASSAAAALPAAFSSMQLAAASAVPAARPAPLLSHVSPAARGRCAFVFLVMKGDSYAVGAITCAYSLRLTHTRHSLVCMVTPDVSAACRATMLSVFDQVVEVPYLEFAVKPLRTQKQRSMYDSWVDCAFTKWNMLSLVSFEKTLFVDADKIVLRNIDHLFDECSAPAGTFSSPWSQPFVERKDAFAKANGGPTRSRSKGKAKAGMPNPYADCVHTSRVTSAMVQSALHSQSFVVIGTMVLLSPSLADYAAYKSMLAQMQPFGFEQCHSMMDEQSLSYYFAIHKNQLIQAGKYPADEGGYARTATGHTAASADTAVPASSSSAAAVAAVAPSSTLPSRAVSEWSYIHQQYNFVPWHRYWLSSPPAPRAVTGSAAVDPAAAASNASSSSAAASVPSFSSDLEVEVPYVFHFFNVKPWSQERAAYLDLESWWEVALAMLSSSASSAAPSAAHSLSDQQREKLRALYDPSQLSMDKIRGCCWCRATLEQEGRAADESWKDHNIFDQHGRTECPQLIKGFERDEARRRGKQRGQADAAGSAAIAGSATVAAT